MVKKHNDATHNSCCMSGNLIWKIATFTFAILFIVSLFTNGFSFVTKAVSKDGFTVTVLNDERCAECVALVPQIITSLEELFPTMEVKEVDYSSKEGQKLYEETQVGALPAFLFDENVKTAEAYAQISQYMLVKGEYNLLQIGASFDPTSEICTNGKDDTGDGTIDCADPTCKETLECREEIKNNLAVFIMSDCPYGKEAIKALAPVLEASPSLKYQINYIVSDDGAGNFQSLHGAYEVEEDIRQLCVKELTPAKYFDFVLCRSEAGIKGVDWKTCATESNLDQAKLEACFTGELGKTLLSENAKIANALGIGASPTWLANNRYQFSGITSAVVQSNVCKYNAGLTGCDVAVSSEAAVPSGQC